MLPSPDKLNEFELGKFVLSNLAAKRAQQLDEGGVPLVQIDSKHSLTIALAEIAAGKITPKMPEGVMLDEPEFDFASVSGDTGILLPSIDDGDLDEDDHDDHDDEDMEDEHDEDSEKDSDGGDHDDDSSEETETSIADLVDEEGTDGDEESSMSLSDLQMKEDGADDESESDS